MAIGGTLDEISDTLESVARVIKERDFKSVDPHFFMEGVVVNQKKVRVQHRRRYVAGDFDEFAAKVV